MSKNNNATSKKSNNQVANVPDPPVPNRAHTEMKNQNSNAENNNSTNKVENKNNSSNNRAENKKCH